MTKAKKTTLRRTAPKTDGALNKFDLDKFLSQKVQTLLALAVIVIALFIFFSPMVFGNKTFQSGDIVAMKSMKTFVEKDRDGFSLWNPYIFCGMPAYMSATNFRWWDFTGAIYSYGKHLFSMLFNIQYAMNILNLILIAFTSFFFMRSRKATVLVSLLVGLAASFSTGIIVFLYLGHITKMISLMAFPLILMMLLRFQEKIKLLDVLIMIIFMHFVVLGAHVQIIYYIFLAIALYYLFYFVRFLIQKDNSAVMQLIKSAGIFVACAGVAMLMSLDSYGQLWEYNKYSTRGTKSAVEQEMKTKEKGDSDFYQYATNWSFSPGEVMTFIIPSFYGYGNSTYNGALTNNQDARVNTYFGQMLFVDVPMYMGVVIFFFGLFAIFALRKNWFIQYLGLLVLLSLLASFGRTFPLVYDIMYNYFPFFDKFRVPSMILTLIQITMPILAGYALMKIISMRDEKDRLSENVIKYGMFASWGIFALTLVLASPLSDWFAARIAEYAGSIQQSNQRLSQQFQALSEYITEMFVSDLRIAFVLISAALTVAYAYINNKISKDVLAVCVVFLALFDLWRIDSRGVEYTENQDIESQFKQPVYVSAIKAQKDTEPFRMINLKQDGSLGTFSQNSNFNTYFLLHDFSGYSGVKPRTYQDLVDVVGPFSTTMYRMLNIKYIVFDKPYSVPGCKAIFSDQTTTVVKNDSTLSRAYFVETTAKKSGIDILNSIKANEFDPKKIAFVEEDIPQVSKPGETAYVKIVSYKDEHITIDASATGNNFMFLGDTYYPFGWKAYVDGKETKIYRANHGFRGVIVPDGKHKVEMIYAPKSFYYGKYASLGINGIIVILMAFALFGYIKNKNKAASAL